MGTRREARIRELAEPLAGELGLYLYDLQVQGGKRLVIGMRVERKRKEHPGDGVTISECATLSRRLEQVLDLEGAVPERYALEVSSPGLERELKERRHFEGAAGEWVRARIADDAGPSTVEGRLVEVSGDDIVLEGDEGRHVHPLGKVERAETVYRG